ncbi:GNAT family N-acetyltransferase [Mucilaginibacter sp. CSA2-8R]|uniref:GNAT family N-acetyltransferase n=1 Tax=Mucilaginibacter sp. CSA2-8R TaxID=3141542 RepID=UPI00315D3155
MIESPNQSITIKRVKLKDIALVLSLFDKYRVFYQKESDVKGAQEFLTERLTNNESVIFTALLNEADTSIPVGFTQLYPTFSSGRMSKNWILNDLYVDAGYRTRGIGKQLIETAKQFARKDGAKFVKLETAHDNRTAQSVYEGIGFKQYNPHDGFLTYKIDLN